MDIRRDAVTDPRVIALLEEHLRDMRADSPPESTHALDCSALQASDVSFWTLWIQDQVAGCIALKILSPEHGEIKSMRVADAFLGKGAGRAMLDHILAEARGAGMKALWLETGSTDAFVPALKLYESAGFAVCGPFGDYTATDFNVFLRKKLTTEGSPV